MLRITDGTPARAVVTGFVVVWAAAIGVAAAGISASAAPGHKAARPPERGT